MVETLLDISSLDPLFEEIFGSRSVRQLWFNSVLRSVFVSTIIGRYIDFTTICRTILDMAADPYGFHPTDPEKDKIIEAMRSMRPHPEVHDSLESLRKAGFRLAVLTNSRPDAAQAALDHAGLSGAFEAVLSAEAVRRMKPAPEPYRMAADRLGIGIDRILLVAAHAWDISGARSAGCATAFIARPGKKAHPLAPQPDITAPDLKAAAAQIIERESASA